MSIGRNLAAVILSLTSIAAADCARSPPDQYTVRGEVLLDGTQDLGQFGRMYRIVVQTKADIVSYPVLASDEEIAQLNQRFVSRAERGTNGDYVAINPKSNVFSTNEVVLLPENLKKLSSPDSL